MFMGFRARIDIGKTLGSRYCIVAYKAFSWSRITNRNDPYSQFSYIERKEEEKSIDGDEVDLDWILREFHHLFPIYCWRERGRNNFEMDDVRDLLRPKKDFYRAKDGRGMSAAKENKSQQNRRIRNFFFLFKEKKSSRRHQQIFSLLITFVR